MLSKRKWVLSFIFVLSFVLLAKLEGNSTLSTNYASLLLEPQRPTEIYKQVVAWITRSDELISVSAPVTTPPLIEYKSIQPLEDGAVLSVDKSQELHASNDGLIIYTGYRKKTGKTLSILYDTGETATYGFVDEFRQLPYTTVNAGDIFGTVGNEILYVQVEKEGELLGTDELIEWLAVTYE
ncbi:M23 family metallopeptidase [Psychrobacillus sp. BM2]|uniref:M23 family metallopeptidase n=1 Tax=Psychrobacillus sp. BM2 TaxID=3400421 RepID=UPI003B02D70A